MGRDTVDGLGPDDARADADARHPGAHARSPAEIPSRGWRQILLRALRRAGEDRVPLLAAGVAFFAFLALLPSLVASVLVYGLAFDLADIDEQVEALTGVLPQEAVDLLSGQMTSLVTSDATGLSAGLAVSVLLTLWSAFVGVSHLIATIDLAYEERDTTSLGRRLRKAVLLTAGAVVVFLVQLALVAVFPIIVDLDGPAAWLAGAIRWTLVVVIFGVSLAVVYRYAPARRHAEVRWVSVGAVVATALWLVVSVGFSLYVTYLGSYARTYGALAGVAIVLFWIWLSCVAILLGAEINAEAEHQTDADSTVGPDRPRGRRGAVKADEAVGRPTPGAAP